VGSEVEKQTTKHERKKYNTLKEVLGDFSSVLL
jgi:hypothetical protein